jgi:hypothetical protein
MQQSLEEILRSRMAQPVSIKGKEGATLMPMEAIAMAIMNNAMLTFAEDKAKKAGCEQVYLCARKGTFLIPWYERRGYKIYDENPEYSKGQTVAMNKYFEDKK